VGLKHVGLKHVVERPKPKRIVALRDANACTHLGLDIFE
jgi:hypothetical protein